MLDIKLDETKEELAAQYENFVSSGGWVVVALITAGSIVLASYLASRLSCYLQKRAFFRRTYWRHTCLSAATAPLIAIIVISGLSILLDTFHRQGYLLDAGEPFFRLRSLALVLALAWFLLRWKSRVEDAVLQQIKSGQLGIAQSQVAVISKLVTITIVVVMAILALDSLNVDIKALLAVGGVGGVAIGFAGKDVFANFFSGFMIYMTRPFTVGDWIQSPDKQVEGTVEHIGWYLTRIRSFDKRPIYAPNSLFSTIVVVNPSRMTHRRIKTTLALRYCDIDVVPQVVKDINAYLRSHAAIDTSQRIMVYFNEFNAYSLDILLYCFCRTTDWGGWLAVQQEIFFEINRIVKSHGAGFAFPTQTLDMPTLHLQKEGTFTDGHAP